MPNPTSVWFHGTNAKLSAGDVIVPSVVCGLHTHADSDPHPEVQQAREFARQFCWVAETPESAAYYAAMAVAVRGGSPHIFVVRPSGDCVPDPVDDGFRCAEAVVDAELDAELSAAAARAAADVEPDPDWILAAFDLFPVAAC